jgi:methionyl aminopeptidase
MPIPIKTPGEIAAMRSSGRLAWIVVNEVAAACRPGVTTRELDQLARALIAREGLSPLLLNYRAADSPPFPGAACVCVNEEIVHAVPSDRIVRTGDAVTIDIAVMGSDGWCADAATTVVAGGGEGGGGSGGGGGRGETIAARAKAALSAALAVAGPGVWWSRLAGAAADALAGTPCVLLGGYCGHGIGRAMHEAPRLCFGPAALAKGVGAGGREDVRLLPGMVVTLEPIVLEMDSKPLTLDDGWTVIAAEKCWAAHEERTVAITRHGCEVLTGGEG